MEEELKTFICYYAGMVFEVEAFNKRGASLEAVVKILTDVKNRLEIDEKKT